MADKELHRVRSEFVDSVSEEVINQLLDDILQDTVVNDGEKDWILGKDKITQNKARDLIDTVKKKGDEASRKLIAHIKRRDLTLYSKLGLSCEQPAPPAAEPQKKQEWSTSLKKTTEEFWKKKQNDADNYPAPRNSIRNRVALLITNMKFTDEDFNRNGAEKDEENMTELLRGLGYEVVKYTNLTGKAIDEAIIEFSKHPKLKDTDSVVVVIMSHGKRGLVLGVNHKKETPANEKPDEFPVDNIYKHLGSEKCPALLNKPKIIIIQACRGALGGAVLVSDCANTAMPREDAEQPGPSPSADEENLKDDTVQSVHREKDFTALLSCTPDTVSYRNSVHGSLMIQFVFEVFNTCAHEDHIQELFRKVMLRFEELSLQHNRQMPTIDRATLTKKFYFYPGL